MRVVHVSTDGDEQVLASEAAVAESRLAQARGLMFRRSVPDDYALVFPFDGQARRSLHMLFVPFDIDAVWVADGIVRRALRLSAWTGLASAVADTVVELPAGAADGVAVGDHLRVE